MITIDQFKEIEMRVGLVVEAGEVIKSTKLIKLTVDIGEEKPRTIFTGVRTYGYTPDYFLNKKFLFVTNLEPRKMLDEQYSQGMILAVDSSASSEQAKPVFISPVEDVEMGSKVR